MGENSSMGSLIKRQGLGRQTKNEDQIDKKLSDLPQRFSMEKEVG